MLIIGDLHKSIRLSLSGKFGHAATQAPPQALPLVKLRTLFPWLLKIAKPNRHRGENKTQLHSLTKDLRGNSCGTPMLGNVPYNFHFHLSLK